MEDKARSLADAVKRVAAHGAPAAAALVAFGATARATAFESLLQSSTCGNPLQAGLPHILGHCPLCWESAAAAALATVIAIRLAGAAPRLARRTARI